MLQQTKNKAGCKTKTSAKEGRVETCFWKGKSMK